MCSRSGRRAANNRIRGPQSALTDFLAANNISAAQISADHERRLRESREQEQSAAAANGEAIEQSDMREEDNDDEDERIEAVAQKKKRKRQEEAVLSKIKNRKAKKKQAKDKADDSDGEDGDPSFDMYKKKQPLPGQLENCEQCDKRFTVTPYSKTGPEGGLLCAKCSKEQQAQKKKEQNPRVKAVSRQKRRQTQSNLLDGIVQIGAKCLQEICIKVFAVHAVHFILRGHTDGVQEVANNIHDVDELGDLPPALLDPLSKILSRRRAITSRTLDLFLRPDLCTIQVYDCGSKYFRSQGTKSLTLL